MSTRAQVKQFILNNFMFSDDETKLSDGESLMESGAVDSTGIMELIAFLEETFNVMVQDEEMIPENLDSVDNLVAYLDRKRPAA